MNPPWCVISSKGKIERIDWDEVERLAEQHFYLMQDVSINAQFNDLHIGFFAVLARAVRDHVLETLQNQPDWQNRSKS